MTIPYEQVIAPFLDWIANANPQITAQSELATAKEFGDHWNANPDAQLWFNVHRRDLVQELFQILSRDQMVITEEYDGQAAEIIEELEGDDDASTQSGSQAPDEGEEEDQEKVEVEVEIEEEEDEDSEEEIRL